MTATAKQDDSLMTCREIGIELGLSRATVQRILDGALLKIFARLKNAGWKGEDL